MQARPDRVVSITLTIHERDGGPALVDEHAHTPLRFIFGRGQLLDALEAHLRGKRPGDAFLLELDAPQAYGAYNTQLVQKVRRDSLPASLVQGQVIEVQVPGQPTRVRFSVKAIKEDLVHLDGNHPLAGKALRFVGMVVDVRPATEQELIDGVAR